MKVELDTSRADARLQKLATYLSPNELVKAGQRAINRAAAAANTELSRRVRARVNLKASSIKDVVTITRASGATVRATMKVKTKGISLREYGARQVARGVSVRVLKDEGRKVVDGAFFVEKFGGHVFMRKGKERKPIQKLFGPSVRTQAEQVMPDVQKRAEEVMEQRLKHEIGRAIERANK